MVIAIAMYVNGLIIFNSEIPEDFMATNSLCSAKFPKVMSDDNSTASGNAIGTSAALAYPRICMIIPSERPFPTSSSMYRQRKFISNTNTAIRKVAIKGPIKDFII